MERGDALLIVDVQNDFCPDGSLAVAHGDEVVPVLNEYARRFSAAGLPVITTRDWHPPRTRHFTTDGGVWPPHCIQGSHGAAFHPGLRLPDGATIVSKGMDPNADSYTAFDGVAPDGSALAALLERLRVRRLFIGGLATDYCVHASTLDARALGLDVYVLSDGVRGVDLTPGDSARAMDEMRARGAKDLTLADL